MSQREIEIDDLVLGYLSVLGDHFDDRPVVAVREHAAPWEGLSCPRCR